MKLQRPVLAKIGGRTATKTPWPKGYSPDIVWSLFAAFSASWQLTEEPSHPSIWTVNYRPTQNGERALPELP